jgi:hypothetical protein
VTRALAITLLAASLAALCACPAAVAHGGGAAKGYRSAVTAVSPAVAGIDATVLDGDDRLQLTVPGDHVVVVDGYEGEPYLRFAPDGVYENARSPATYLNEDRYGKVDLPDDVDPDATPDWRRVVPGGRRFDWHDHRIHWMSRTLPPKIQAAKDKAQHVFNWTVPATLGGKPLTIAGSLDYQPPPTKIPRVMIVILVLLVLLGGTAVWLRRRRGESGSSHG